MKGSYVRDVLCDRGKLGQYIKDIYPQVNYHARVTFKSILYPVYQFWIVSRDAVRPVLSRRSRLRLESI